MICNIPWVMKQQRFAWLMATAMAGFQLFSNGCSSELPRHSTLEQ